MRIHLGQLGVRSRWICAAAAIALPLFTVGAPAPQAASSLTACANKIVREPVLVFDVTGATFAGPYHERLSVYSDGLATTSRNIQFPPQVGAETTFVSGNAVKKLANDLAAAGAFQLCDQNGSFADIPLTTVTVFKGATDAFAHTFSYYDASGNVYTGVSQVIADFLATHFSNDQ